MLLLLSIVASCFSNPIPLMFVSKMPPHCVYVQAWHFPENLHTSAMSAVKDPFNFVMPSPNGDIFNACFLVMQPDIEGDNYTQRISGMSYICPDSNQRTCIGLNLSWWGAGFQIILGWNATYCIV